MVSETGRLVHHYPFLSCSVCHTLPTFVVCTVLFEQINDDDDDDICC